MFTVFLIDHILKNSKEKVNHYGVIFNEIPHYDFLYCTRKTNTVKTGKHNTISIRSWKKYSKESLFERLRKKDLPYYSTFKCIDAAYINLTAALQDIVNEIGNDERYLGKSKNTKLWFASGVMKTIRLRDKGKGKRKNKV